MSEAPSIRRLVGVLLLAAAWMLIGAAPAAAGPIGMVCTNGPTFHLVANSGTAETPDGNASVMWSYANEDPPANSAFQTPGPVLCVTEGATVTIRLRNSLPENVSMVFPGQEGVSATGGTPGLFAREAPAGGEVTYSFTAGRPGTYLYESGSDQTKQLEMGLHGALVVRPLGHPDWAYNDASTRFDPQREYLLLLGEIDPALHHAVEVGGAFDPNALHNRYFTVNGRAFPDTIQDNGVSWLPHQPYGALVRVQPQHPTKNPLPALVRMINAGELNHPFHPHGNHLRLIAQDGRLLRSPAGTDASTEHFGETIGAGQAFDLLFRWTDQDNWDATSNKLPVAIPNYRNLNFKDGRTWYSGSPYIGTKGTLPATATSQNVCGELYFPWHSHALNEFTNFDEGFGGMATMLRVDPLGGCTAVPTATRINAGTLRAGGYASLSSNDDVFYQVNATTVTPFRTDWYGSFSGLPAGLANLTLTYRGKNSVAGSGATAISQTLFVWNWTTNAWVSLGAATPVGTTEVELSATPPGSASNYVGRGAYIGQLRMQVVSQRTSGGTFFTSGDLMKATYDAP